MTCRTGCLGLATATAGSVVRVTGDGATSAASIVFLGRHGRADDVVVPPRPVAPAAAEAAVPAGAHGGPVRLVGPDGQRSARSSRRIAVGRGGVARGGFEARVAGRKAYVDTTRRATLDVFVGAARCGAGHAGHIHQARTAPGWQSGGAPVDALPSLTAWDAAS